eukprot:scaffold2519_cov168-Amphora_coffeaeformis.AAC.4
MLMNLTRSAVKPVIRLAARGVARQAAMQLSRLTASYSTSTMRLSKMDDLKSGTSAYMDLYPEASTDGGLRLGNIVPDFSCETTHGYWESFHEWKKGKVGGSLAF